MITPYIHTNYNTTNNINTIIMTTVKRFKKRAKLSVLMAQRIVHHDVHSLVTLSFSQFSIKVLI